MKIRIFLQKRMTQQVILTCIVKDKELLTWQSSGGLINSVGHVLLSQTESASLISTNVNAQHFLEATRDN
jgi:hypothetical protein